MKMTSTLQGTVKRHPDGFGFLIPDNSDHPDVFLSRGSMDGVMTNDRVEIEVFKKKESERYFGKVIRVLEHGVTKIIGRYHKQQNGDGFILDGVTHWGVKLVIPFKQSRGAIENDLVAVEITQYPLEGKEFLGKVVDIIGDAEDPLNDIKRVIHLHKIPEKFTPESLHQVEKMPDEVLPQEIQGRKDLRELPLITIDGVTAKDFDDAIYVSTNPSGFHVWVAIADVSHYVKMETALDDDAYQRGTSVYFPNFVVPMLPEKISNGLCSLKPNVDRLAYVCEIQLDFQGVARSWEIYEAVIHSHARVTYGEAQEIISKENSHKLPEVQKNILCAADLAKILMAKRYQEGSLDLDIPETEVIIDEGGHPIDIIRSERVFAHKLIEELMLLANVCVAKTLAKAEIPALYRIHEEPDRENIDVLQKFLHNFGSDKKLSGGSLQKKVTKSLQEFQGRPEGTVLSILTLRSMKQAQYSTNNVGHFGLGFEFYTHFTSPIRRYPDLIVHRLLKSLKQPEYKVAQQSLEKLTTAGNFLSACEQRSVKSERQLISIKKARFMQEHVGEILEGVISSVVKFGIFVLLRKYDVDGLVKKENLGNDFFEFDEENLFIRGKKTGIIYRIGDPIKIQVAQTNIDEGQIDFVLEEGPRAKMDSKPKSNNSHHKKRRKAEGNSKGPGKVRFSGRRSKK